MTITFQLDVFALIVTSSLWIELVFLVAILNSLIS